MKKSSRSSNLFQFHFLSENIHHQTKHVGFNLSLNPWIVRVLELCTLGIRVSFLTRCGLSVADLGARGTPPSGAKFLHYHTVFGKNWSNNRLAPPWVGAPSGKSWIHHCLLTNYLFLEIYTHCWKTVNIIMLMPNTWAALQVRSAYVVGVDTILPAFSISKVNDWWVNHDNQ